MKTIGVSELMKLVRPVSQQIHFTLQAREAEYELVPISIDQGLGILIWSPLAGGLLSGKYRRGHKPPEGTRQLANWGEPPVQDQENRREARHLGRAGSARLADRPAWR